MCSHVVPPETTIQSLIKNESDFLGFKNFTLHADLTTPVGAFEADERIFVKCGETRENFAFSALCSRLQEEMGMQFVKTELLDLTYDSQYWRGKVEGSKNQKWSEKVTQRMRGIAKADVAVLPAMMTAFYPGVRVTDLHNMRDRSLSEAIMKRPNFAKDLVEIHLFAAYIGIKDAQGFNMLVSVSEKDHERELGSILLVDMNRADAVNMEKSNRRGMAQKMHAKFRERMRRYILREYKQIAVFMRTLKERAPRHELYDSILFDESSIDQIERGETKKLEQAMFVPKLTV